MEFLVNELCIACGACEATCPEVFELSDEEGKAKVICDEVPKELEDSAKEAMNGCPVDAIEEK